MILNANQSLIGDLQAPGFWMDDPSHRRWLEGQVLAQLEFFKNSLREAPGFHTLGLEGNPREIIKQELHTTTRLIHVYAIASQAGFSGADEIVRHGLAYLESHHLDSVNGGYCWAIESDEIVDDRKLAYGHVFVLLAAASARMAGYPEADELLHRISAILEQRFWDDETGLFVDEWTRGWGKLSPYRGMNANMHGAEALMAAYEATGETVFLSRAGRILDFFIGRQAQKHGWRIPEHYTPDWDVDYGFEGDPMFQPPGTTPGHSFEMARLTLQHWDLSGRPENGSVEQARALVDQAMTDAWLEGGGLAYTLNHDGTVRIAARYWWPVTEAISVLSSLIKLSHQPADETWYRRLWCFADAHFVDHNYGGWFPEAMTPGGPKQKIFSGKPDIYHSFQACVFPLINRISRQTIDNGFSSCRMKY